MEQLAIIITVAISVMMLSTPIIAFVIAKFTKSNDSTKWVQPFKQWISPEENDAYTRTNDVRNAVQDNGEFLKNLKNPVTFNEGVKKASELLIAESKNYAKTEVEEVNFDERPRL